jgi:hypothetical protein
MNKTAAGFLVLLLFVVVALQAVGQESDYAVKEGFEGQYKLISSRIETATTIASLDSLKAQIDSLELIYIAKTDLLDKVLYPETFAEKIKGLRSMQSLTYDKVYLIQTQGVRLDELQMKVVYLTSKLDTLSAQRDKLWAELQSAQKSSSELHETVKRLQATLAAKDRLIFALVDSIFLPYGKDFSQLGDVQRESVSRQLEKASVMGRVEEIANDNVKFLSVTQLQGKDFANLVDQYQQFNNRWRGLRDKMTAVAKVSVRGPVAATGARVKGQPAITEQPGPDTTGARVDSALAQWGSKLQSIFWGGLRKEFTDRGITVDPFVDAPTFSASIRTYVAGLKASGQDPSFFVNEIWKARIDKEWREALTREGMLGKTEYAALDKAISELSQEKLDLKFIIYLLVVIVLVFGGWWLFVRKPKVTQIKPE